MEELATAAPPRHRGRRHRRKASDAGARAAYGDVFGGPPRFAGVPGDYAEVFGGVTASCSIPYLDLPPSAARDDGAGGYDEIFGRFDFGDFAAPFEDLLAGAEGVAEEIAWSSGSSRSSIRIESGQLDAEPSMHYKHYPNVGCDQHFDEEQFSTISFSPDGEQQFSMSYNKTTRGRPDDLVELATCMVEPSISYVVDCCNLSNDSATNHVPLMDNGLLANGQKGELSPPFPASSSVKSANSVSVADQKQHTPTCVPISENFYEDENYHKRSSTHSASSEEAPSPDYPFLRVSDINLQTPPMKGKPGDLVELATCVVEPSISYVVDSCNLSNDSATNHVPLMDNGLLANGQKGELSPPFPASSSVKSANSVSVADQKQHMPTCVPISENFYEDDNYHKRSSTHSASSEEAPSPDYPFLRVSHINLQTPPIKVQPPSMPPSNLLKKRETKPNGDSEVNPNSAAAAAIKEAMEFAEARLKAAKELMERKGDSFKLRKRPGHHRGTKSTEIKSTEIKENKTPEEVHVFEEHLTLRRLAKEEKNYEDLSLMDKNRDGSLVKLPHCDRNEKDVLPPGKPQQIMQSGSKLEQLGRWASGAEFYELISHDQKCKTDTAACEGDNGWTANPFTKPGKFEKGKGGVTAGDLERYGKLCDGNDITELRMKHANLREDDTASMEVEHKAPTASEVPLHEERAVYEETSGNHFKECLEVRNSPEGHDDDGRFEISCINGIPPKLRVPEISSLSLETCISGGHANDNKNCSDASTEETPLVGKSNKDNNNKEGLKIPCADETLCTSVRSQILQEHPEVPNIDEIEASQAKVEKLEESAESYVTQCFLTMSSTVHGEAETNEKDKLFSFVDEACVQNENEIITEAHSEALIHEEMRKFETEEKTGQHEEFQDVDVEFQDVDVEFQDVDVDWDAGSPENKANVTLKSSNANETEEAEVLNVFVGDSKLMESNVRTCGTFDKDSDQLQESQLKSQDLENRMDGVEDLVSDGNEKEAKEPLVENNEKTPVEEILNYDSKDGQTSMETGISKGPNDVYAEVNVRNDREGAVLHSGTEVIANDDSDYTMKMNTCSKDPQASFSEACTIMQHLSQNAESVSSQMSDKSTPVLGNLEEDCRKAEREFPTEKYAALEEGENTRSKMEERDGKDRISSAELKNQQSVHLDSDVNIMPKFAVDTASNFVQKSREETPDVQRIEGRDNIKKTEREIEKEEVFRQLDEEKERECKMEKEKEQTKERPRRELEEEKERERERAKDRLAVQRATREAHERAFAETRAKAERIALERITSARQRASAEAREKEEKASAEAAAENASREARIKAERAAVERATAEARERAIEKAKAAADAKERMERFKSSFKDSFKDINQDNQQDTQFQTTASYNHGRSTDSFNQVAEVESALRHKARSERHQRTAERAAKALAEKNMRDMLAQREQAEKHRLAEFLDPEVKRWSNGKEGNLRALLSTLQYILGSDSGWQSVPLTDLITAAAVKKAYRRATLCVHPDKLQQRGATIRQKYICEKVFDLLKEAWNKFNSEER